MADKFEFDELRMKRIVLAHLSAQDSTFTDLDHPDKWEGYFYLNQQGHPVYVVEKL